MLVVATGCWWPCAECLRMFRVQIYSLMATRGAGPLAWRWGWYCSNKGSWHGVSGEVQVSNTALIVDCSSIGRLSRVYYVVLLQGPPHHAFP